MTAVVAEKTLGDFTDAEIKAEYEERFPDIDDVTLDDFSTDEMIEHLEKRGAMPEPEPLPDEVVDLIANAARVSPSAARAYDLLRAEHPETTPTLAARQMLIAGRMGGSL